MTANGAGLAMTVVLAAYVVGQSTPLAVAQQRPPPMTEGSRLPRLVLARQPISKFFLLNEQGQTAREVMLAATSFYPREIVGDRYRLIYGTGLAEANVADFIPINEAAEYFAALIVANPKHGFGYGQRAIVLLEQNQLNQALADLDLCLTLLPNHFQYRLIRAENRIRMGQYRSAFEDLARCLELEPKHAMAVRLRGICHSGLGQPEQAIADFDECLKSQPYDAILYRLRAVAYRQTGRRQEAIADLTMAMQRDPVDPIAPHLRAVYHFEVKDYAQALADLDESLRRNSQHRPALLLRSEIARIQKRYKESLDDLRTVLKTAPDDIEALNSVAWIHATSPNAEFRNGAEAVKLAEKCCQVTGFQNPALLNTLAAAYAEAGDYTRAVSTQQKLLDLIPKDKQEGFAQWLQLYKEGKPYRE